MIGVWFSLFMLLKFSISFCLVLFSACSVFGQLSSERWNLDSLHVILSTPHHDTVKAEIHVYISDVVADSPYYDVSSNAHLTYTESYLN